MKISNIFSFAPRLLLVLESAQAALTIPPYDNDDWNGKIPYDAIAMPTENLPEEDTGKQFTGKFWVDGIVSVTADADGEQYLWVLATVHSPQLPNNTDLSIFG